MEWNAIDWLDLVLRWFHVMAGISWIGGSLYLMWLDRVFASPERAAKGERGEPWLIDLAGSLLVEKLKPGPDGLARTHVWFKRETTLTWVSGILLLAMVAHLPGGGLLTDASGQPIDALVGAAVIAALLVLSWGCYDLLWRMPLGRRPVAPGVISYAMFVAAAWILSQIFSGRAA
ncbi:MAG: urate hydroxylase PuuD, partial [bacterium]|nr:urate hydroxylase PuuD [bacterium]